MMTESALRKVWIDRKTREALADYAWANRTTSGEVIRGVVTLVRDNPHDTSQLTDDDTKSEFQISVRVNELLWQGARNAAATTPISFNAQVRRRLRKILIDEGFMN